MLDEIQTKLEFEKCIAELIEDYRTNKSAWENASLETFLSALLAWSQDCDGYYINRGEKFDETRPDWQHVANLFLAARVYE